VRRFVLHSDKYGIYGMQIGGQYRKLHSIKWWDDS